MQVRNIVAVFLVGAVAFSGSTAQPADDAAGENRRPRVEKFIYKKTPQAKLAIHVHFPPNWKKADKHPAIVFFFGGGWRSGSVRQFTPQADYFAQRGMVAARADYRVYNRHKTRPDKCVEDCKSAVRWLRAHASKLGIDPDRIAAGGGSAGGHTAAATAILQGFEADADNTDVSSKPNLLVLFNPALNTAKIRRKYLPRDLAKKISPVHHLSKHVPPTIIFFGTDDRLLSGAREFIAKAGTLMFPAELWIADGQKHGFFNRSPWRERTLFLADQFLIKHDFLKGEPTVKPPKNASMTRETPGGAQRE